MGARCAEVGFGKAVLLLVCNFVRCIIGRFCNRTCSTEVVRSDISWSEFASWVFIYCFYNSGLFKGISLLPGCTQNQLIPNDMFSHNPMPLINRDIS